LLTLGAGLFAAAALAYTARNYSLSREGQVTDRYTKAIEQLGSERLDVRIGGIYALERIARDSARDHPTIMAVLSAFIREHSREQWPPLPAGDQPGAALPERMTRPDVDAAVIVVVLSRNPRHDRQRVDLTAANLAGANLLYANLVQAILNDTILTGAHLGHAHLTHAIAYRADLTSADLGLADLTAATLIGATCVNAHFVGAELVGANLSRANFTGADLANADLRRVNFTGANLAGVNLSGADLTGVDISAADLSSADFGRVDLNGAYLTGALWPRNAAVPEGWIRDADSGRLRRANTALSDSETT
jgi:uncharacterized protein YjbI with pentapeptide repeats